MTVKIQIKEEGGCELYNIYINGKLAQDGMSGNDIIEVRYTLDEEYEVTLNGKVQAV